MGLVGAKGRRLSRDSSPGKHWGVGAVALVEGSVEPLLPVNRKSKVQSLNKQAKTFAKD